MIRPPFDSITGQPQVAQFLSYATEHQLVSHAYLFCGPQGAGKNPAARALAQALVCRQGGCGSCDDCARAQRGTHPDIKVIVPEGAHGYITEQIHELIHDTNLAPIRAQNKVYLLTRADLLQGAAANAFLKTLEEPPGRVTFVLLARTRESVLPTISSRCQTVMFRTIPEDEAVQILMDLTQAPQKDARIALASTGLSVYKAREFMGSSARRSARIKVLEALERLPQADALEVLESVRALLISLKQPLDEVKLAQEKQLAEGKEYLSKGALSTLEQRHKRVLTSQERESVSEALDIMRSWLRDCLLVCIDQQAHLVNTDFSYTIQKTAQACDEAAFARAIKACDEAEQLIHYNVSVQLIIEALFLTLCDELSETR